MTIGLVTLAFTLAVIFIQQRGDHETGKRAMLSVVFPLMHSNTSLVQSERVVDVTTRPLKEFIPDSYAVLATTMSNIVPLRFDFSQGIYSVAITVGKDVVQGAFDSGSSALVIGTKDCVRGGRGCQIENGAYDPTHNATPHLKRPVVIEYGSQAVVTDVVLDAMAIRGFDINETMCQAMLGGHPLAHPPKDNHADVVLHDKVVIHAAKMITGPTAANVFGMAPNTTGDSLIQHVLPHGMRRVWGFTLTKRGGAWVIGTPPKTCNLLQDKIHRVPMVVPRALKGMHTQFYMAHITDILVGPELTHMSSVLPLGGKALYLMVDTGSTLTYMSQYVSRALAKRGVRGKASDNMKVALRLDRGVHVVLNPSVYVDDGYSYLDTSSDIVETLLGVEGILLGAVAMRGLFVQFDLDRNTIGFARGASVKVTP